ncbi:hypothetical protein [Stutzerimonas stutzeri]|uniref:hypothetical protein n=1 Tax=Stutzerimonas stutzeri TaxID=316 RepID=UPI0002F1DB1D|nr:hypothetical protein [Stutzerimonas stutzeri]
MNSPLRFNDALLITDRAFKPFQCVAWTLLEGNGELSITVLDGSESRTVGHCKLASNVYSDPVKLGHSLEQARADLSRQGMHLAPWQMPE